MNPIPPHVSAGSVLRQTQGRLSISLTWIIGLLCPMLLTACLDDEDYTLSPDNVLTFSREAVELDTIISGRPTKTETFSVYNRAGKALRIASVSLSKGASSPFIVNVDGQSLGDGSATDFEIPANDSIIGFLMCNAPENDSDSPVEVSDELVFVLESGVRQTLPLRAASQDVIRLEGTRVTGDFTLDRPRPYLITDSLVVEAGGRLSVEAGARLFFHAGATLVVHGTLDVRGTLENPVTFRGDRLENMFSGQPYDRIPGQWGGVVIKSESFGSRINYCDIHSSVFGIQVDSAALDREKLRLENSIVHNTSRDGLSIRHARVFAGNTQITNAGGNCITLRGGDTEFVHCTVARFYYFTGGNGVALDFANYDGTTDLPLRTTFTNCIVTGFQDDELMGSRRDEDKGIFDYRFDHCLLNTPETEDEHIVNCIWDDGETARDRNFVPEFDLGKLIFTFGLNPESAAVGKADEAAARHYYPSDRLGHDRSEATLPDIGCYQHQTDKQTDNNARR